MSGRQGLALSVRGVKRRNDSLLDFSARRNVILRGFPAEPALQDCIRISVGSRDELAQLEAVFDAWEERQ